MIKHERQGFVVLNEGACPRFWCALVNGCIPKSLYLTQASLQRAGSEPVRASCADPVTLSKIGTHLLVSLGSRGKMGTFCLVSEMPAPISRSIKSKLEKGDK